MEPSVVHYELTEMRGDESMYALDVNVNVGVGA